MNALAQLKEFNEAFYGVEHDQYSQLHTYYDEKYKIGWFLMNGAPRPCFTPTLLNELSSYLANVKDEMAATDDQNMII